jgi:integrase
MEPTFKIILDRRHPKKNSALPLRLRVYQNRSYKEYTLGIDISENDWNEQLQIVSPSNASHRVYNTKIASIKAKVQKTILFNEDEDNVITPARVIEQLNRKEQKKEVQSKPELIKYGREHIAKLQVAGNIGNSIAYSCAINKLQAYAKTSKLTFEQVNYSFIEAFNNTLLAEGIKINSISLYLRSIRALFNKAIKERIIEAILYPFNSFKIKSERTINRTLTIAEIASIVSLDLPTGSTIWHHRNLFLLSYCLIGINFSDLLTLTKENFVDDRIVFRRRKTHKVYSIMIQPKAKELFSHYMALLDGSSKSFILPFVTNKNNPVSLKKDILRAIKNTNHYLGKMAELCNIDKPITTYYARYSWANIARVLGYSKDLIAEALGHDYGNKVTGIYLDNYSNSVIDEMNDRVIKHSFMLSP